jgi:FkbM family methyltransferase
MKAGHFSEKIPGQLSAEINRRPSKNRDRAANMTISGEFRRLIHRHWPLPDTVNRQLEGGYSVVLHPNADRWERKIYWQRTYEPATLALIDACLRPGDRMIDIGANFGLMTLHASRAVGASGSVIALEPHPRTFRRLEQNLRRNGCKNVSAINAAAGEVAGTLELFDTPAYESGQASFVAHTDDGVSAGHVEVRLLDDMVPRSSARTFIKIDVEGFEYQVLRGASETIKADPIICMECDPGLNPDSANALAAYRLVMATDRYGAYRFKNSKFRSEPTLAVTEARHWETAKHENAIFVPHNLRDDLPASLFG